MSSFWFPVGSTVVCDPNGSLNITAPPGWIYIGIDKDDNPIEPTQLFATIKISCECKSPTGWCNPFYIEKSGVGGCMGQCGDCRMSTRVAAPVGDIEMKTGGFINLSISPHIIDNNLGSIPAAFNDMMAFSEIHNLVNNYLVSLWNPLPVPILIFNPIRNEIEAPTGNLIGFVNIAGRAFSLPIPDSMSTVYMGVIASCDCNCPLDETPFPYPKVYQCKDICPGKCTLTIKNIIEPGGQIQIVNAAQSFNF